MTFRMSSHCQSSGVNLSFNRFLRNFLISSVDNAVGDANVTGGLRGAEGCFRLRGSEAKEAFGAG